MKVQVDIELIDGLKSGVQAPKTSLKIAAKPFDSVQSLKQRILAVEPIPFPQELQLDGKPLADDERLGDIGVGDGQTLRLIVRASEDIFVRQLAELLEAKPLSATELGLLYCHQRGASAKEALAAIGSDEQLPEFLKRHKRFTTQDGGLISLCKQEASCTVDKRLSSISEGQEDEADLTNYCINVNISMKTQSGNIEECAVQLTVNKAQTVQKVCERALAAECIPFAPQDVVFQGQVLPAAERLGTCKVNEGATVHLDMKISHQSLVRQLADVLKDRSLSVVELGDHYCYRFGAPVSRALQLLGLRGRLRDFLKANAAFSIESGLVVLQQAKSAKETAANEGYLKLHEDITSCPSIKQAQSALDMTIKAASEGSFLSIARVIRGGSVGQGTAIKGNTDAKAMLLLNGMPPVGREKWMLPLLHALAAALWHALSGKAKDVVVKGDAVHVQFEGVGPIEISLDAVAGPAALAAERTARFFEKQPVPAKITMKLLKWWRDQKSWRDVQFRPSDLLLEVLAAEVAATLPSDQDEAMEKAMELMANIKTCRLADPADPAINLVDEAFDSRQMAELATK